MVMGAFVEVVHRPMHLLVRVLILPLLWLAFLHPSSLSANSGFSMLITLPLSYNFSCYFCT